MGYYLGLAEGMSDCWSVLKCLHMVIQFPEDTCKFLAKAAAIENDKYVFRNLEQ